MARAQVTREQYDQALDSHRAVMGDHKAAARASGLTTGVATRLFTDGHGGSMPAIRTVLRDEMVEARAQLAMMSKEVDHKKIAATRKDLVESRRMQAQALRFTRNNAIAAMSMSAGLLKAGMMLSTRVSTLMANPDWVPTPQAAVRLLRSVAETAKLASDMNLVAEECEKRILGTPDVIVAHTQMTPDQAVVTLAEGERTLGRLRRRIAQGDVPEGMSAAVVAAVRGPDEPVH